MKKYLFIVNPTAGSGKTRGYIEFIEDYMRERDFAYKVHITQKPMEATKIVLENSDFDVCIAVGGDGTANEVAKGIIIRGHGSLGIIPSGTGNDLAQALGINMDKNKAMERIFKGNTKEIDLGEAREDYFFNIASLGFDAWVVKKTNQIKKVVKGKASYVLGVLAGLVTYRSKNISVDIDGELIHRKATLVAVGNGHSYGGGMKILPMARLDDQLLDICIVRDISNLKLLILFPSIFKGDHVKYEKHVEFHRGKKIKVQFEGRDLLNMDGELYQIENEVVEFSIPDKKLSVIV